MTYPGHPPLTVRPRLLQVARKDGDEQQACVDRAPALLAAPHLHEHDSLPVGRVSRADGAAAPEGLERRGEATEAERGAAGTLPRTQVSSWHARNMSCGWVNHGVR